MDDGGVPGRGSVLQPAGPAGSSAAPRAHATAPRADQDETTADAARDRYRAEGVVAVTPDSRIGHLMDPDEVLIAVHEAAVADSRAADAGADIPPGISGALYLTSRRLVFAGGVFVEYPLGDVVEAVVAGEDVLLVMRDGVGLRVAVDEPRLLRVQIAAARAARREQVRGAG